MTNTEARERAAEISLENGDYRAAAAHYGKAATAAKSADGKSYYEKKAAEAAAEAKKPLK